jgi:hypothetical protein
MYILLLLTTEPSTEDVSVPVASPAPQHVQQEQELYDDVRIAPEEPPQDLYDDVRNPPAVEDNQDLYDDVRNPPAVEDNQDVKTESNVQISPEQGVVARALYDYQASEYMFWTVKKCNMFYIFCSMYSSPCDEQPPHKWLLTIATFQ